MSKIMKSMSGVRLQMQILLTDRLKVIREEIMEAFNYLKIGKAPGPTHVYSESGC